ncbi:MAG: hypothetical protein LN566_01180 [Rickettsia endosymbiont of Stiretrus anchorago]|nr:hypothetical protein [Rickettsia endosymbiont of Stiretrus anchorago]
MTTNNSVKKLRLLKYSLLASISAAAIIAIPLEGVASSKDTYQDRMEYKKALNRARSVKRKPPTKKGRESLKSRDSSQDIEDFYKNSSLVQHLEKERYTPTPREKTSPDNFNNSGDETFVTANNTLPSTLSTSFDQMEYQEPNSQSDFNPAQASTPKKRGVFSRLFGKGKKDDNTFPPQPPARNKNNTNNVSIPVTPRVQKIVDNSKYDSGGYLKPIEVFPDPVVDVQPQKEDQSKQYHTFTQADLNVRMLPLVETYMEVGGLIKKLQKTPSSSQQKLIDTSLASIKKEQKNLENIIQELNILRLKLVNKPQNETSYNRRIEEKLAEAKQIESRINGYQDKIKTNVGFIAANKEDTHIVPKNNLALLGHQNIEYSLHRINSANSNKRPVLFDRLLKDLNKKKDEAKAVWEQFVIYKENKERKDLNGDENRQIKAAEALLKQYDNDIKLVKEAFENYKEDSRKSNDIQSPASSNLEYLALEEKFASLRKHEELDIETKYHELRRKRLDHEKSQLLQDLAQEALNLSEQESQLQQDIENLGSTPSSSNSSDSDVEIKAQGYSATPLKKYASVHSISDLVGSKEDLGVEFEKLVEAEGLNNESKTDRENIDPKFKTEFKEIMDGFDRVDADIDVELKANTVKSNANSDTKAQIIPNQSLLPTNEHSSLGVSNGREDEDRFSGLSDGGKSEYSLLGVGDGREDEDRFLGLSDGREDKPSSLRLSDGRKSEHSLLGVSDGSDDEHGLLALSDGRENENDSLKLALSK